MLILYDILVVSFVRGIKGRGYLLIYVVFSILISFYFESSCLLLAFSSVVYVVCSAVFCKWWARMGTVDRSIYSIFSSIFVVRFRVTFGMRRCSFVLMLRSLSVYGLLFCVGIVEMRYWYGIMFVLSGICWCIKFTFIRNTYVSYLVFITWVFCETLICVR